MVAKTSSKSVTKTSRAGLVFPVGRVESKLKKKSTVERISGLTAVCVTTIIQEVMSELLRESAAAARYSKSKRIFPKHIADVIRNDADFTKIFKNIKIAHTTFTVDPQLLLQPNVVPERRVKKSK